jgi:hypothetical protein
MLGCVVYVYKCLLVVRVLLNLLLLGIYHVELHRLRNCVVSQILIDGSIKRYTGSRAVIFGLKNS